MKELSEIIFAPLSDQELSEVTGGISCIASNSPFITSSLMLWAPDYKEGRPIYG